MTHRIRLLGALGALTLAVALPAWAAKPPPVKPRAAQSVIVPPKTQELDKATPILYGKQPAPTSRQQKSSQGTPGASSSDNAARTSKGVSDKYANQEVSH
jgi:hypothetical protein